VLTYISEFITYFIRALRGALYKKNLNNLFVPNITQISDDTEVRDILLVINQLNAQNLVL